MLIPVAHPFQRHTVILDTLDHVFSRILGSSEQWARRKAELKAGGRWAELIY